MIETERKFYKGNTDSVAKAIFCKEENRDLLKELIKETLELDFEIISVTIPELTKKNIHKRGKVLDMVVKAESKLINIEVNTGSISKRRNAAYIFNLYSNLVDKGNTYNKMPKIIQINLTTDEERNFPMKSKYTMYDKENDIKFIDNLEIYEFNLTKIKDTWYNKGEKFKLLSLLDCDKEELEKVKGDDIVEKFKNEIEELNKDFEFARFLSEEEEERLLRNTLIEDGIKQNKIEIAKSLLKNNIDIDIIMDSTGLSKEELKNIS